MLYKASDIVSPQHGSQIDQSPPNPLFEPTLAQFVLISHRHVAQQRAARHLRQQAWPEVSRVLWGDAFWSPSYCVLSCGGFPLDIIKAYVEARSDPDRIRTGANARNGVKRRKKMMAKEAALTPP